MNGFLWKSAALMLIAVMAVGCSSKKSPLVGMWTREVQEPPTPPNQPSSKGSKDIGHEDSEMGMSMYMVAKTGEGKITEKGNSQTFKWEEEGKKVKITYDSESSSVEYTYTLNGDKLTLKPKEGETITLTHIKPPTNENP